jgi:hypothetical protein
MIEIQINLNVSLYFYSRLHLEDHLLILLGTFLGWTFIVAVQTRVSCLDVQFSNVCTNLDYSSTSSTLQLFLSYIYIEVIRTYVIKRIANDNRLIVIAFQWVHGPIF